MEESSPKYQENPLEGKLEREKERSEEREENEEGTTCDRCKEHETRMLKKRRKCSLFPGATSLEILNLQETQVRRLIHS